MSPTSPFATFRMRGYATLSDTRSKLTIAFIISSSRTHPALGLQQLECIRLGLHAQSANVTSTEAGTGTFYGLLFLRLGHNCAQLARQRSCEELNGTASLTKGVLELPLAMWRDFIPMRKFIAPKCGEYARLTCYLPGCQLGLSISHCSAGCNSG